MLSLTAADEALLLEQLRGGQAAALTTIYRAYWQRLYQSAYALLADDQACEDIIQDLFLQLWLKRESLRTISSLKAYLHAAVRYEVFRQIRAGHGRSDLFDHISERLQASTDTSGIEYQELQRSVDTAVNQLPDRCQLVYRLSREEQLSYKQIAEQLNISPKTVENQIAKALSLLRISLSNLLNISVLAWLLEK